MKQVSVEERMERKARNSGREELWKGRLGRKGEQWKGRLGREVGIMELIFIMRSRFQPEHSKKLLREKH